MTNKLELWESWGKIPPEALKNVSFGARSFTAIDPYFQIKLATAHWGAYGSDWGLVDVEWKCGSDYILMSGYLKYPLGKVAVTSNMGIHKGDKVDNEASKKCLTDALTKGLSYLGMGKEIFLSKFEDSKYKDYFKEIDSSEQDPSEQREVKKEDLYDLRKVIGENNPLKYYAFVQKFGNQEYRIALMGEYFEPFKADKMVTKEKERMKTFYETGKQEYDSMYVLINDLLAKQDTDAVADILNELPHKVIDLLYKQIPELR